MEHNEHRERARSFAEREIAGSVASRDRGMRWDDALFRSMGEGGLLGAGLPRAFGGGELGGLDVSHHLSGFGEGSGDAGLSLAWVAHARERIQLGRPLAHSQSTRATLADMKIRYELCRRLQARAAFQLDRADLAADRDIAAASLFLARSAVETTRDAAQIHGARGAEVDCLTERLYRDATVVGHLGEGNDILRSIIAGSLLHLG